MRSATVDTGPVTSARTAVRMLRIQYFAVLREQVGISEECFATTASNPAMLYSELLKVRPLKLPQTLLKVAVNAGFVGWDHPLEDGDKVVFIPPVAGG